MQFYILSRILSYFLLLVIGLTIFVFAFQILRILDLILISGNDSANILSLLKYLVILTFPIILPTALLFSLFLAYKNLGNENELVAFMSLGISKKTLFIPAVTFSLLIFYFCYFCNTEMAPISHIRSSLIENKIKATAIQAGLKEGVFFNHDDYSFFVNKKNGNSIEKIFIYNKAKNSKVFAQKGNIKKNKEDDWNLEVSLNDGKVFFERKENNVNSIDFKSYRILLPLNKNYNEVTLYNLNQTNSQIKKILKDFGKTNKNLTLKIKDYKLEIVKRFQMSFVCIVFLILALSFSFNENQRDRSALKYNLGLFLGMGYWLVFFSFEAVAFKNSEAIYFFIPSIIYLIICFFAQASFSPELLLAFRKASK